MFPRSSKVAIYARYSSDIQNPLSLKDQIDLLKKILHDNNNLLEPMIFSDAAISGAVIDRPGLSKMLEAVKSHQIDLVIAEGLDRISRSFKDMAYIFELFVYNKANLWTIHEGNIAEIHIAFKGTMNALFLKDLKDKVKRGQKAHAEAGLATSVPPYGYRIVRGKVDEKNRNIAGLREIDPEQSEIVKRIFTEYVNGRSLCDIYSDLNNDGIPAPRGGLWTRGCFIRRGSLGVGGVLLEEQYLGKLFYNRTTTTWNPLINKKETNPLPRSKWTIAEKPELRIIDDDLWYRVQKEIVFRKIKRDTTTKGPHFPLNKLPLTDWVKCGLCGGPKCVDEKHRYRCSRWRRDYRSAVRQCSNSIGTQDEIIFNAVFATIRENIHKSKDLRSQIFMTLIKNYNDFLNLNNKVFYLKEKIARLINLAENGVGGPIVIERIKCLQNRLEIINSKLRSICVKNIPTEEEIKKEFLNSVGKIRVSKDTQKLRGLFKLVLEKVVLTPTGNINKDEQIEVFLKEKWFSQVWSSLHDSNQLFT
ncbi:MAG: recombinase family protein [Mycoplasmataceae bacterium]|jgi:DNA invertase Pin-like site-specific DNA recombinase|nr:recombinase family protein [Mycoplasmataceae bacterium]